MRNGYLNGGQTAWAYTYTGIKQLAFLRTIFTLSNPYLRDGEEGFNDFADHLTNVEALKREKEMEESIMVSIALLRNQWVNSDP